MPKKIRSRTVGMDPCALWNDSQFIEALARDPDPCHVIFRKAAQPEPWWAPPWPVKVQHKITKREWFAALALRAKLGLTKPDDYERYRRHMGAAAVDEWFRRPKA